MADEQTQETRTWTTHTFKCIGCGKLCYVSREHCDRVRRDEGYTEETMTDAQVAEGTDFCIKCVDGGDIEGEKVVPQPPDEWERGPVWSLNSLTPDEVRMLDAAVMALDGFKNLQPFVDKVHSLVATVKSRGVWPGA